jgi:ribonuclease HI
VYWSRGTDARATTALLDVAHDGKRLRTILLRIAERTDLNGEEREALAEAAELICADAEPELVVPADPLNATAVLFTDGAARGNPGPAGIGAVLKRTDGDTISEISDYIGETTNNVAEYRALIAGVDRALTCGVREIEVRADSELLIKQLQGQYQVRNAKLKPLYHRALELLARFSKFRLVHVRREFNSEADRLANHGIDRARRELTRP